MTWKQKEKELTQEEAIALAQKELARFWIGSSPLIAGVKVGENLAVYPLSQDFVKKPWVLLFIEPTQFSGPSIFNYFREWYRRYHLHQLGFLVILSPAYSFLLEAEGFTKEWLEEVEAPCPVVIDSDNNLFGAFGIQKLPRFMVFDRGKKVFDFTGNNWFQQAELEFQSFLRITDPGLPLFPVYTSEKRVYSDTLKIDFGYQPRTGKPHPTLLKMFLPVEDEEKRVSHSMGVRPRSLEDDQLFISGAWVQDSERMITSDTGALIGIKSLGSEFSLIAAPIVQGEENPRISIEVNGAPVIDSFVGPQIYSDDSGRTLFQVNQVNIYHLLTGLPKDQREVTLRFLNADVVPVALYGIRSGD